MDTGESSMRENVLSEIRRIANLTGVPPGKQLFTKETGIKEHQWSGVYWTKWSDALKDAGYESNAMQGRYATEHVLAKIVDACRHFKRIPTSTEMKMFHNINPSFPTLNTIYNHFPARTDLLAALLEHVSDRDELQDVLALIPKRSKVTIQAVSDTPEGLVYLLKSGNHYKIGRSDQIERRIKEISVSLPETVSLVHSIKTDDPAGIEAYWHRRFASLRLNGEWFKLGPSELRAFRKRSYQ